MSTKEELEWDTVDNLIAIDLYDDTQLDIVAADRTYILYKTPSLTRKFHIWKCCYLTRRKHYASTKNNVIKASFCAKRADLIKQIIQQRLRFGTSYIGKVQTVFTRLEDAQVDAQLYSTSEAFSTYHKLSEIMFSETQGSAIRGTKARREHLQQLQATLRIILSIAAGISEQALKDSAVGIESPRTQIDPQNPSRETVDMQLLETLHQRHFDACAQFLLEGKTTPPLVVKLSDIGYNDYYCYGKDDSYSIARKAKKNIRYAACFRADGSWDDRELNVRKRNWQSLGLTYEGAYVNELRIRVFDGRLDAFFKLIHRRAALHFTALLLIQSGANTEILPSIDFEEPLSFNSKHKRIPTIKPRRNYANNPISFSTKFAKTWRLYTKVRTLTLVTFAPEFGRWGIPFVAARHNVVDHMSAIRFASNRLGFPSEVKRLKASDGRHFKTTNLLEKSDGNLALIAEMLGRSERVTRDYYAHKAFSESATNLTRFFQALHKAVTIKAEGYSAQVNIINDGARTHTGHCQARDTEKSALIKGVTEVAPEPRCGAPATCFFCEHYALHASVEDIKLILACREWLQLQTKIISRNDREHFVKFSPIIDRIDDILESFRAQNEAYKTIHSKAHAAIEAGEYPSYWRNKLDAILNAQESL